MKTANTAIRSGSKGMSWLEGTPKRRHHHFINKILGKSLLAPQFTGVCNTGRRGCQGTLRGFNVKSTARDKPSV